MMDDICIWNMGGSQSVISKVIVVDDLNPNPPPDPDPDHMQHIVYIPTYLVLKVCSLLNYLST